MGRWVRATLHGAKAEKRRHLYTTYCGVELTVVCSHRPPDNFRVPARQRFAFETRTDADLKDGSFGGDFLSNRPVGFRPSTSFPQNKSAGDR